VDFDEDARWLVLVRGPITVACNLGPAPATVPVGLGEVVLASGEAGAGGEGGRAVLAPESVIVLSRP